MSLKTLSKTRWKIEANSIVVYPYGLSYILSAILLIIFAGGYAYYLHNLQHEFAGSIPLLFILLLIILFFIGWAGTSVQFDLSEGMMRKKFMGILTVKSIPFSKIYAINPVSNQLGSYKYHVFRKDNRYGKGTLVSCSYGKNDDPNAVAFVNEVINPIHRQLEAYDGPDDFKPLVIEQYKFFNVEGSLYKMKRNKIGSFLLGLTLFAIGIHELTPYNWLGDEYTIGRICFLLFTLIGGPALILASFTEIALDKNLRIFTRKNPIGLSNKTYSFDHYNGVQTVRKTTNLIYTGTDVQLYFFNPSTQKEEVIVLQSFFSTKKVDRFISELNSIMN